MLESSTMAQEHTQSDRNVRILTMLFLLWIGFSAGFLSRQLLSASGPHPLLAEAEEALSRYFYGEVPQAQSIERGLVGGLVGVYDDPHTTYVEPAAHELQSDDLSGEYGGIGAYITSDEDGRLHVIPFEDGPAAEAGIMEGDILLQVDHQVVSQDTSLDEVISWIRGPVGETVTLQLEAIQSGAAYRVSIERQTFALPSVSSFLHPTYTTVAVIRIHIFSDKTAEELEQQIHEMQEEGAQAIVLDLRDNGGGLLSSGIDVARLFLTEGLIVTEHYKDERLEEYWVEEPGPAADIPLGILVNHGTASASEIVAGSLQLLGRAELYGSQTFGKGSVQVVVELSDGSSLFITSARWFLANEQPIEGQGLTPDYDLNELDPDSQLLFVVEQLNRYLEQNQ
jgi:carboxyl-terminal processing protease